MDSIPQRKCSRCNQEFPATLEHFYPVKNTKLGLTARCRQCVAEVNKERRASNPNFYKDEYWRDVEKSRAKGKRAYWADPEKAKQSSRNYAQSHKDQRRERDAKRATEIAQYKREWRKNNPDKVKKHKSESQKRNRPSANIRSKRYRDTHPEQGRVLVMKRIARKRNAEGSFTKSDIDTLHKTQKGLCWWCGKELNGKYHIDHRVALSRGGSNWPSNLCLTCEHCNLSKNNKLPHEWNGRLL